MRFDRLVAIGTFSMRQMALILLAVAAAFGAADAWAKVKTLKTGTELHIFKKGSTKPVTAMLDQVTDENLIVLVKKTQTAIPLDDIDRVDARPTGGSRVTKQTTTKETYPDAKSAAESTAGRGVDVPGTSTSTNVSIGGKGDFETVYRRAIGAPKK